MKFGERVALNGCGSDDVVDVIDDGDGQRG